MPKFEKEKLASMISKSRDERIEQLQAMITELENRKPHAEALEEWRTEARTMVKNFAAAVDGVSDQNLAQFRIPQPPYDVSHEITSLRGRIRSEESNKDYVLGILDAIVTDKDGNVNVTVSDLRRIGVYN